MKCLVVLVCLAVGVGALSGCAISSQEFHGPEQTAGKRLSDLEQARKEGALTDAEFKELKQKVIASES